ncbi:hypothetical protein GMMP13_930005 [Candidatus Magnetomoraceae bacterium gMMP-13]
MIKKHRTPFQVGSPIQNTEDFIGRSKIVQEVFEAMSTLQNLSLHGERRTGKTSLLFYISNTSISQLDKNYIPVYFNFQAFSKAKEFTVWQELANTIAKELKKRHSDGHDLSKVFLDSIKEFFSHSSEFLSFCTGFSQAFDLLNESDIKINFLFDEFELTAKNPYLGDSFYNNLRSLGTEYKRIVSYVIATRTGLATLQDTVNKYSSPFFNIFTTRTLSTFTQNDIKKLIFQYIKQAELDSSFAYKLYNESSFLYDITGYHPFFIQTLCYHLMKKSDKPDWPLGEAKEEALQAFKKDSEKNFKYYWNVSSIEEKKLIKKIAVKDPVDWNQDKTIAVAQSLKDRCLLIQAYDNKDELRLFSSAFSNWVKQKTDML